MNLIQTTRAALAAAVLAGGVLGASVAPTFADQANVQPTQVLFTSATATQDPAKAFDAPGTPLTFSGIVAPNASGTVIMLDFEPDGASLHVGPVPVADGQFSVSIHTSAGQGIIGAGASLGSGTHWLTAVYLGNNGLAPSGSPVFTEVIQGQHF